MTPKRPEATCLIAERRRSPFASGVNRTGSSPPSPVFERPPMRFIAIASVSCASREIEPSDMAPVANRFTISLAGSTSSSGMPPPASSRNRSRPRSVYRRHGVLVDGLRVRLVRLPLLVANGVLEQRDRVRVPLVVLAVAPPGVEADHRQQRVAVAGIGARVAREHVAREALGADAADPRGGAGEVTVDEVRREADGLEDLGAAVRGDRRDPHLRQRLQEALAEPLDAPAPGPGRPSCPPAASPARRARPASRASGTG